MHGDIGVQPAVAPAQVAVEFGRVAVQVTQAGPQQAMVSLGLHASPVRWKPALQT
jgi:hypothetical protein